MGRPDDLAAIDTALTRIGRIASSRRTAQLRAARAGVDLTPLGVTVLATVYRQGPINLRDVAAAVDTQPSRVSKEVNRLRALGYVATEVDPDDARATLLTVRAPGRKAFERYRAAADTLLAATLRGWRGGDLLQLARLLTALADDFAGAPGRDGVARLSG